MTFERKLLVKDVFDRLDRSSTGYVNIEDVLSAYDITGLPSVENGYISSAEVYLKLIHYPIFTDPCDFFNF